MKKENLDILVEMVENILVGTKDVDRLVSVLSIYSSNIYYAKYSYHGFPPVLIDKLQPVTNLVN